MDLNMTEDSVTDVPVPESPTTAAQSLKASENVESRAPPISPPLSSLTPSRESILTTTQPLESTDLPLKPGKRLPATPSSHASGDRRPSMSGRLRISRGKSPETLSSLSSFDESEASHAERRFLRLYEELESHCSGTTFIGHAPDCRTVPRLHHSLVHKTNQLRPVQDGRCS